MIDRLWTRNGARIVAGAGAFILTVMVLVIIVIRPDIADNDLFKTIAQAIVIQGLIGLVMAFLFTGAARKSGGDDDQS
jgi:hypothetical protein